MKRALKIIGKTLMWLAISVVGLLALAAIALYMPPVQNYVVGKVLKSINASGDMKIEVKQLRLSFPLTLTVDSLDFQTPGMAVNAGKAHAEVSVIPLVMGEIAASEISLNNTKVTIGTPDSVFYMRAGLRTAYAKDASVGLFSKKIKVETLNADSGKINIVILPDTVPSTPPDSVPADWKIELRKIRLSEIDYGMQMLPTIDTVACHVTMAELLDGYIDMPHKSIRARQLAIDKVDARYITSTAEFTEAYMREHPTPTPSAADSIATTPWTINARKLLLTDSHGIYATRGAAPGKNFNPEYIEVTKVNLEVDSFMNRGSEIRVPLKISGYERCGIGLNMTGTFSMDSTALRAQKFEITTPVTEINLDATMGLGSKNAPLSLTLGAELGYDDIIRLLPDNMGDMRKLLPPYQPLIASADLNGTLDDLRLNELSLEIPRYISIEGSGYLADYSDINNASGKVDINGKLVNGQYFEDKIFDAKTAKNYSLPPLTIKGSAKMNRGAIDGGLQVTTKGGDVALDAKWNNRTEAYDVAIDANHFPVQSIAPTLGVRDLDATITLKGHGLDLFSPKTALKANIDLASVIYQGEKYNDITLDANLDSGNAIIKAESANRNVNFTLDATGNLSGDVYDWTLDGNVHHIDLQALAMSESTASGSVKFNGKMRLQPRQPATRTTPGRPVNVDANLNVSNLYWQMLSESITATDINLMVGADDTLTRARLSNHDLIADIAMSMPIDSVLTRMGGAGRLLSRNIDERRISVDTLQRTLPPFVFTLNAGTNNIVGNYLAGQDKGFNSLRLKASNDSMLNADAQLLKLKIGTTQIDTIDMHITQRGDYLRYNVAMNNSPGTLDEFAHASLSGYFNRNRLTMILSQENLAGETGYSIGALLSMADSTEVKLQFVPYHPIIGYKSWEVNRDNFVKYDFAKKHFDANLKLVNAESSLNLFTEHVPGDTLQEDVILKLANIELSDWLSINPFAPPIKGQLSADMRVTWDNPDLNGSGTISLANFMYGKQRVGNFDLGLDVRTNAAGTIRAISTLNINGERAMTLAGNLNDSTATDPFLLDLKVTRFPLNIVNPFLPTGTATVSGRLNGEMAVTGELTKPMLNGSVEFDSTLVYVTMLGNKFHFSKTQIPVKDNIISFNNYKIWGCNDHPLTIDGNINLEKMTSPAINLSLNAQNMQIVNSKKSRKAQVYGKAFIDLDATAKGTLQFLKVNANLDLLPGSNVTYVMTDAVNDLTPRSNQDMVKFVNLNDTTAVVAADTIVPPAMMLNLTANLVISDGTTINVDLSADGKNKVQLQPTANLDYTMGFLNDSRLTGRIDINKGFVRYTPPLMSEKLFNFNEGSYVSFTGELMNPTLNLSATDRMKVNVTQSGQNSRLVNFDVGLDVTGNLENMNVEFDLACPDDITVANELSSMNAQQRASQAMNLLLYGVYSGGGTSTVSGANAGTNALFSFLEGQINNWAAQAVKGVDISFGIHQYDQSVNGANTTAINYSYQVSKSLFDDRFKIVVGGNYTANAEADENFAENLIADISFEYLLNKSGTMYVRLFRHTGFESILEGEITQTGVGFVYKKKIGRVIDLFKAVVPRKRRETETEAANK